MTAKRTTVPLFTAVADIGRFPVLWTELLLEVLSSPVAVKAASGAVLCPAVLAGQTDILAVLTAVLVEAGIAAANAVHDDDMIAHFLGNCG